MRKILVTAISGDIGNNIVEILAKTDDEVYGCDVNAVAAGMDSVKEFYQSVYAVDEHYIPQLLSKCEEYGITHLIPNNEREIEVINNCRELFENKGIKLIMQSKETVKTCLDKYLTMKALSSASITVPKFGLSPEETGLAEDTKFICKGRKSNGSKSISVFKNAAEFFNSGVTIGEDFILQEYIEGDEYTMGVFAHDGDIKTILFKREIANGHSHMVELTKNEKAAELANKCAKLFNLEGYINLQMRERDGEFYIFEINPRISGTVGFRNTLEYTDVIWWLDLVDGIYTFKNYKQVYKEALGVRVLAEKFLKMEKY